MAASGFGAREAKTLCKYDQLISELRGCSPARERFWRLYERLLKLGSHFRPDLRWKLRKELEETVSRYAAPVLLAEIERIQTTLDAANSGVRITTGPVHLIGDSRSVFVNANFHSHIQDAEPSTLAERLSNLLVAEANRLLAVASSLTSDVHDCEQILTESQARALGEVPAQPE